MGGIDDGRGGAVGRLLAGQVQRGRIGRLGGAGGAGGREGRAGLAGRVGQAWDGKRTCGRPGQRQAGTLQRSRETAAGRTGRRLRGAGRGCRLEWARCWGRNRVGSQVAL